MKPSFFPIIAAFIALGASGCSSISVQPRAAHRDTAPRRIVVADFGYADKDSRVRVDREGAELRQFKANLTAVMRRDLVKEMGRFGLPVQIAKEGKAPPGPRAWLITGDFTRVNQGSRALRIIVGAGAGGTKMQTRVRVTDTATGRTVCAFRTTGGSNAASGIITSYGPLTVATLGGALINIAGSSAHGVTEDARRTSKMIGDYISVQLAKNGAIPHDKVREPKILDGPVDPLGSLHN
ncbi:MAG TPA: DUF4410 domain-containing protein [Chthoniobacteraceae bacterium]|jgi:hypothetical protein|nr:DUF4410 domain-containing protein [Chthoniobacteraceae bacterium]